ncbi:MAG: FAD:protein FMN transferase [Methylocystis sp.]|nr:FAD:protein FMN transferase [Methylocystis sp.]
MRRARPLLGTIVEIDATGASARAEAAIESAFDAIADIHRLMSFHDPASDVSRLNRQAALRPIAVDDRTLQVLRFAIDLHERSGGVFDISVARRLQTLGLLPIHDDDETARRLPGSSWAIELTRDQRVRFHDPNTRIDLGGVAKGFAVDCAIAVLRECGVSEGLVNAGGDLASFGERPWTVCLRDPRTPTRLLQEISVRNEAVASSAGRFDPFRSSTVLTSAIVDPDTGKIVSAIAGASVWARSCMSADALTKVVMLQGERAGPLLRDFRARALFVTADGDVHAMADWREAHLAD